MKMVGIPILMETIAEIVLMEQEKIGELEAMNNSILCWLIPIIIIMLCGGMYFLIMWLVEREYRDLVAWEKKDYKRRLKKWKNGRKFTKHGIPIPRPNRMGVIRY